VRSLLAVFIACQCGATFDAVNGRYVCSGRRRKGLPHHNPDAEGSVLEREAEPVAAEITNITKGIASVATSRRWWTP
jgi:hypothetical protein